MRGVGRVIFAARGWIGIIGIIQLTGGFSLFTGGGYGRFIGIFAAALGALESLFAIGGQHPWWALGVFEAVRCVTVLRRAVTASAHLDGSQPTCVAWVVL